MAELGQLLSKHADWAAKHLEQRRSSGAGIPEQQEIIEGLGLYALHCVGAWNGEAEDKPITPAGDVVECHSPSPLTQKTAEYIQTMQLLRAEYEKRGGADFLLWWEDFQKNRKTLGRWLGQELLDLYKEES